MTDEAKDTITIVEKPEQAKVDAAIPTREELRDKGWTKDEMDRAEKRGMVAKSEEGKKPDEGKAKEDGKTGDEITPPGTKVDLKSEDGQKPPEKRPTGELPDFTIKDPEKEKVFLDTFGPGTPQRAMYFRMKNERQARQKAEAERDQAVRDSQSMKDRIAALESGKPVVETDEDGNPIDPDDKPFTLKQWKEYQRQEAEAQRKQDDELRAQAGKVSEALKTQEEFAKSVYPDFVETVKLAKDLTLHLEERIPDRTKQAKALKLIRDIQVAAYDADKMDLDSYNASMIGYELGQMHPEYGKPAGEGEDGKPKDPSKANGGLTPEEMERIKKNTQRGRPSASLPAGDGKRTMSVEDVTLVEVQKMSRKDREAFKTKYPAKYKQLLRG